MANARQAVEVYTQGTKAWFEDDREAWVSTTCVSSSITDTNVRIVFQSDNDDRVNNMMMKRFYFYVIYNNFFLFI
jgi:myosin-5